MPCRQPRRLHALLLLLLPGLLPSQARSQQPVFVESVTEVPTQETERVIGSLRARSISLMAALEEGVLLALPVREADRVERGDVLARQDTRRLEAGRVQLQADRALAEATRLERQAQLDNSRSDLVALESAAASGAVSDRDLRSARTAVQTGQALAEAAKQSLASLDAQLALIDIRIADAVVRAPFDGQITARHAEVGQWIRPGEPLVTLVSSGQLEAWLELPERFIGRLDASAESLDLRIEASRAQLFGTRPRMIPMVDERSRTLTLVLQVEPQDVARFMLQAGMSISAEVRLGSPEPRLVVAKDAVLRRGTNSLVARVGEDGLAQLVPIKVLFASGDRFAIEALTPGGLVAGQDVVIEGNERLFPGTPLEPLRREAPPAPDGTGKNARD